MRAYGLATHIWNNNWKSGLLLAGFPVLLLLLAYALLLLYAGLIGAGGYDPGMAQPFVWAAQQLGQLWPYALVAAGLWFAIAYAFYQTMIDAATGAREIKRTDSPALYALLENLCISRGEPTPTLRLMETPALNAFATGLHRGQYSITVTRGLVETLDRDELEAVLAHELTHIRNRDVRLLVISIIFVGIFSFVGEMGFRALRGGGRMRFNTGGGRARASSGGRSDNGGGAAIIAILVALAIIAVAYGLAVVIRFALSRKREYLADAGAVELTKNPDAMIRALQKISGAAEVPGAPAEVREMFIENPHADFAGLFATHPPIERRIEALRAFAGARV